MIKINYISRLPLKGDSPSVLINENKNNKYIVEFIDKDKKEIVSQKTFNSNEIVYGERQWYTNWLIKVYDENSNLIHVDDFNLENKTIFIKNDSKALGDTIAWMPYIEVFRKKNKCNVVCSTFFNDIVKDRYKEILFVSPNTHMDNIYAQYYIGASDEENEKYTPLKTGSNPLQKTACDILGLEYEEIRPDLEQTIKDSERRIKEKYVCISEYGSNEKKMWKEGLEGWQKIVDFLNKYDYKVAVISREKTNLKNVIDLTGNYSLKDRMIDLYHSEFFIGISSGLSWLSWSVNTHTVLISDVTPIDHEFSLNATRISSNALNSVDYEIESYTTAETVLDKLKSNLKIFNTDKIKIGITIAMKSIDESIWTNGMKLNILTLVNLLNKSNKNYEVYLLNTLDVDLSKKPIYLKDVNVEFFDKIYTEMDLIISMGVQISKEQIETFKSVKPTNKLIAYKCGNNYLIGIEEMLFKEGPKSGYIYENELDEIWYVPQQHENNVGYYSTLYRTDAILVPFVWDKVFLDYSLTLVNEGHKKGTYKKDVRYDKTKDKKVIGIMEPNLNIVKTCIIPSLITEECYRSEIGKEKIEKMMITNSDTLKTHKTFLSILKTFDLFRDGKIRLESRYQTSYFLTQYADILVCHQLMNPLNYLYLDAAYMGYPVLHNAYLCKDLGYYYEGSSTKNASKVLEWILENHDNNIEAYDQKNKQILYRYYVGNPKLIETYDILIENLFNGGNKKELIYNPSTNLYENI
jgi:autotransporter strand-loop-strand O-heptosyltransferase